ncbi:ATP-binding protein [Streptomyces sp. NPDC049879]|uniref:ATP-binding protein n=1 Tax=Streptomyces sp. NPDC049879 TaxID=3365598 RepID=UPI0037891424
MDLNSPAPNGEPPREPGRVVELVAGDFLLTVNPVDGGEIVSCPPGRRPITPRRAPGTLPAPAAPPQGAPLLERDEIRHRLYRLLARGRSVRLTGPSGSGRTALLAAVARDAAELAPYGVIWLSGHRRTADDILQDLYAAVHTTSGYRPGRTELAAALREIGAVVVLDDAEFGDTALDEVLAATPECAFLLSAGPDAPAAAPASRLQEIALPGLTHTAALELFELAVARPLDDTERAWAADLCAAVDGLPLHLTEAGALLRLRAEDAPLPEPARLTAALASTLSQPARELLRLAVALGGELPGRDHLGALSGDTAAATARTELLDAGLLAPSGGGHRLPEAVAADLTAAGYADTTGARAHGAAVHYTWWLGRRETTAAAVAAEADALLATVAATQRAGHAAAVTALARAAAPPLASALLWSAWERVLRSGQESARVAGEVAQQAYFHHELGVLAICRGKLDRARVELEASTALRGVLADAGGAVAGRRALTLVEDLSRPALPQAPAHTPPMGLPARRNEAPALPPADPVARAVAAFDQAEEEAETQVIHRVPEPEPRVVVGRPRRGLHRAAKRNVVVAGAGALLVAVLGTVVAFGLTSGPRDDDPENATPPDPSATGNDTPLGGDDDDDTPTRRPSTRDPEPDESESPSETPSESPSATPSDTPTTADPTYDPPPSSSGGGGGGHHGGGGGGDDDTPEPPEETDDTPTDEPTEPEEPTDEPTDDPTEPEEPTTPPPTDDPPPPETTTAGASPTDEGTPAV